MTTEHTPDELEERLARELRSAAHGIGLTPGSEVAVVATGRRRRQRRRQASTITLVAVIGAGTALTIRQLARNGDSSIATDTPTTDVTSPPDSAVPQPSSVTDPSTPASSVPGSVPVGSTPSVASTDVPSVQLVDSNMVWTVVTPDSTAAVAYGDSSAQIPGVMLATAPGRSDNYVPQFWRSDDGVTWTPVEVDLPFGSPNNARFVGDSVYAVGTAPGIAKTQPNPLLFGVSSDGGLTWNQVELPVDTNDANNLPYIAGSGAYASVYPIDGGTVIWVLQGAQLDVQALAEKAGVDPTDATINAAPEGLYVPADPTCVPNQVDRAENMRVFMPATTVVGNVSDASMPSQIGGCDLRLIPWAELGVPDETVARAFDHRAREFRVIDSDVTELEVPDGVGGTAGTPQDPLFATEDGSRFYRMGPDGVLAETDAPDADGYPIGSNATTSFVQSDSGNGMSSKSSIVIGASTDAVNSGTANWDYNDWSDLVGDGRVSYQMQSGVTAAGLVEVLQVSQDRIAAQGGVTLSTGGYTVSRASARSPIVITNDATGKQVDLTNVWYGPNGVVITDDSGNELATLDGPTFQAAINDPGLGSDPDDYMVAVSADGAHASLESISELLGVDASQISSVPRISSVDGKTVIAVTMRERDPSGVPKQLVLVGTPRT